LDQNKLEELALASVAEKLIESLPPAEAKALLVGGISKRLEELSSHYNLERMVDAAAVKYAAELLAAPEYQERLRREVRSVLDRAVPLIGAALTRCLLEAFGSNDRYNTPHMKTVLEQVVDEVHPDWLKR